MDCGMREGGFISVRAPSTDEIQKLVRTLSERVERSLSRAEFIDNYDVDLDNDDLVHEFPGMAQSLCSSIRRQNNLGQNVIQLGGVFETSWMPMTGMRCAYHNGFSLHANTAIAANDREGLEHLCRYIARPAILGERLKFDNEGNIIYQLKKPYGNGTPLNFFRR
jgi:hypothetical protein